MAIHKQPADSLEMHVNHCLHSIRQSLMCSVDITPIGWPKEVGSGTEVLSDQRTQVHTCRNFDRVRDWAAERDMSKYVKFGIVIDDAQR
jgi:hypothetical protein